MRDEVWKITLQIFEFWNLAPCRDTEHFDGVAGIQAEVAVLPLETAAQNLRPIRARLRDIHGRPSDPGYPFADLGLVAPGDIANGIERGFDVHRQIEAIRAEHIPI